MVGERHSAPWRRTERTCGPERPPSEQGQISRRSRMPNRPGDDRNTPGGLGDRGGQRDATDNARQDQRRGTGSAFAEQPRVRIDGPLEAEGNREQGWKGGACQGHRARIRLERSARSGTKGWRRREPQSRAHGGHRTPRRRSSRSLALTRERPRQHRCDRRARVARIRTLVRAPMRALTVRSRSTIRTMASAPTRRAPAVATASLGGERRPNSTVDSNSNSSRGESYGNH